MTDLLSKPPHSQLLIYQTEDGRTRIQVRLEDETVWLTQKLMVELFQKDVCTINEHIQNIFEEGELSPESIIRKFWIAAADGKSYESRCSTPDEGLATCKNFLQVQSGLMLDLHGVQSSIINLKSEMIPC